jgi:hypothetical protein
LHDTGELLGVSCSGRAQGIDHETTEQQRSSDRADEAAAHLPRLQGGPPPADSRVTGLNALLQPPRGLAVGEGAGQAGVAGGCAGGRGTINRDNSCLRRRPPSICVCVGGHSRSSTGCQRSSLRSSSISRKGERARRRGCLTYQCSPMLRHLYSRWDCHR